MSQANPSPLGQEDVATPDGNQARVHHADYTPAFNFEGILFFSEHPGVRFFDV